MAKRESKREKDRERNRGSLLPSKLVLVPRNLERRSKSKNGDFAVR